MLNDITLKTTTLGGFDKRAVLTYIDDLSDRYIENEKQLKSLIEELTLRSNKLTEQAGSYQRQIADLEAKLRQNEGTRPAFESAGLESAIEKLSQELRTSQIALDNKDIELKKIAEQNNQLRVRAESYEYKSKKYDEASSVYVNAIANAQAAAEAILEQARAKAGRLSESTITNIEEIEGHVAAIGRDIGALRSGILNTLESLEQRFTQIDAAVEIVRADIKRISSGKKEELKQQRQNDEYQAASEPVQASQPAAPVPSPPPAAPPQEDFSGQKNEGIFFDYDRAIQEQESTSAKQPEPFYAPSVWPSSPSDPVTTYNRPREIPKNDPFQTSIIGRFQSEAEAEPVYAAQGWQPAGQDNSFYGAAGFAPDEPRPDYQGWPSSPQDNSVYAEPTASGFDNRYNSSYDNSYSNSFGGYNSAWPAAQDNAGAGVPYYGLQQSGVDPVADIQTEYPAWQPAATGNSPASFSFNAEATEQSPAYYQPEQAQQWDAPAYDSSPLGYPRDANPDFNGYYNAEAYDQNVGQYQQNAFSSPAPFASTQPPEQPSSDDQDLSNILKKWFK